MMIAYLAAAFIVGLLVGAMLGRARVFVKVGEIEIHGANPREVSILLRMMHEHMIRIREAREVTAGSEVTR